MLRHEINIHHGRVVEVSHLVETRQFGSRGAAADVYKNSFCFDKVIADTDSMDIDKTPVAFIDRHSLSVFQPLLDALVRASYHGILACFDFLHVNRDWLIDHHSIFTGAAGDMCSPRAGD